MLSLSVLFSTGELQGFIYMDEITPLLGFYSMRTSLAVLQSKMLCEIKQMI